MNKIRQLTVVLQDCENCAKFTYIFRKKFYLSGKISVTKFATLQSHKTLADIAKKIREFKKIKSK